MSSFRPSELLLTYTEWDNLYRGRREELSEDERHWYAAWFMHDFAMSPRDDNQRRMERLGHYLGWFAAKEWYAREGDE